MADQDITIQADSLVKKFGDFTAVDGVSFQVSKGEIYGFLGPNGSGKTTTIRMMLGLLTPTSGTVRILGSIITGKTRRILSRVGYMSQQFSLYNDLTVLQNLNFYGQAYGIQDRREKIEEGVERAGLEGYQHTPTSDLAGGWRQRLALGAAILHQPEVIFLDEPTAGVDPVSRRSFWDLLYSLVAEGITVFITTHYMDEAEHCHRLAFLQRGQIIARGSPEEIKQKYLNGEVLEIHSEQPDRVMDLLKDPERSAGLGIQSLELHGSQVHVIVPRADQISDKISQILNQRELAAGSMAVVEPSLEDVFIACMRESEPEVEDE